LDVENRLLIFKLNQAAKAKSVNENVVSAETKIHIQTNKKSNKKTTTKCPVSGCNGLGNKNRKIKSHRTIGGCPYFKRFENEEVYPLNKSQISTQTVAPFLAEKMINQLKLIDKWRNSTGQLPINSSAMMSAKI